MKAKEISERPRLQVHSRMEPGTSHPSVKMQNRSATVGALLLQQLTQKLTLKIRIKRYCVHFVLVQMGH